MFFSCMFVCAHVCASVSVLARAPDRKGRMHHLLHRALILVWGPSTSLHSKAATMRRVERDAEPHACVMSCVRLKTADFRESCITKVLWRSDRLNLFFSPSFVTCDSWTCFKLVCCCNQSKGTETVYIQLYFLSTCEEALCCSTAGVKIPILKLYKKSIHVAYLLYKYLRYICGTWGEHFITKL